MRGFDAGLRTRSDATMPYRRNRNALVDTLDALQSFLLCLTCAFGMVGLCFLHAVVAQKLPPFDGAARRTIAVSLLLIGCFGQLSILLYVVGFARRNDQLPAALAGILFAWIGAPTCYYLLRRCFSVLDAWNPGRRY